MDCPNCFARGIDPKTHFTAENCPDYEPGDEAFQTPDGDTGLRIKYRESGPGEIIPPNPNK